MFRRFSRRGWFVWWLLFSATPLWAQTADDFNSVDETLLSPTTVVFAFAGSGAWQVNLLSPLRDLVTPAQDFYAPIASKYGQPRTTGTNPHTGVDFQTISQEVGNGKRPVYPVGVGTVVSVDRDDWGIVAIRLDWDQDGVLDDLYAVYIHLIDIPDWVTVGRQIGPADLDTPIGKAGNKVPAKVTPPPIHLHFALKRQKNAMEEAGRPYLAQPLRPYYSLVADWNNGHDLDFMSAIDVDDSGIARLLVYAMNNGLHESVAANNVVLYHREDGTGPWTISTMNKLGDAFLLNLRSVYAPGTVINLFARASRSAVQPTYNYSLMKPKYYQPSLATLASPFYGGPVELPLKPYFVRIVP